MKNLLKLASLLTKKDIPFIREAYDITLCKKYGGDLTEEQYNQMMDRINPYKSSSSILKNSNISLVPNTPVETITTNVPIVWSLCSTK
jgi:hypothetical protein